MPFKLKFGYHLYVFFKKNNNHCSYFKTADKLAAKLLKLLVVCYKNFYYAQKLYKKTNNKAVKPRIYVCNNKV